MRKNDFLSLLVSRNDLKEKQVENLEKLKKVAEKFHRDAETYHEIKHVLDREITKETLVLESGHQPNFLPYAGVWRKAFLLDFFAKELSKVNTKSIPLFGFLDYNLCTAKWLFRNRIPYARKEGFETVGFKISRKDEWMRFDTIEKPSEDEWENETKKMINYYKGALNNVGKDVNRNGSESLETLMEEMWKSYERGKSFSDVNAILFSRVCNRIFGLNVLFFRYSDVQRAGIFVEEWEKIIYELQRFNRLYNEIVNIRGLEDIGLGYRSENSIPFWYHCECGGKVPLSGIVAKAKGQGHLCGGECPICKKKHELNMDNLEVLFENMSPRAVMRNLVFSEGLGTALFISGAGGSLRYGLISNEISREIGFNLPLTLVWSGRDYYLGTAHKAVLKEMNKYFDMGVGVDDFLSEEIAFSKIKHWREEIAENIKSLSEQERSKRNLQKYNRLYQYSCTLLEKAGNVFSLIPSMLDIFVSVGFESILGSWKNAPANLDLDIEEGEFYKIERDVIYGDARVPLIYRNVKVLEERNDEIDPLGMFKKRNKENV